MTDLFGTAAIRERVLGAWETAPVRFREDANLEEDLVLGGYRDRVVVELAQNAADAAARAGVPGRLRLTLVSGGADGHGATLSAANTGAALDAGGVQSLSTLRASAKRDEGQGGGSGNAAPVGRFGVGFAAVLAVSDAPRVLSRDGGVRFSAAEAREAVRRAAEQNPELAAELDRRGGRVPVLRLPYAAEGAAPWGYDTVVELPLRDEAAVALARRLLTELDDTLLLALPQLTEIVVELDGDVRTLTADRSVSGECVVVDGARKTRWRLADARGELAPDLLADRPVEERIKPRWSLTWAVPVDADGGPQRLRTLPVLHAPTPTDEPLGLPALLIASFPLEVTRRRVAPGPLADFLLDRAAEAYAGLVTAWPVRTPALLRLVPGPMGEGAIDADLRRRIAALLPDATFLPAAQGDAVLRPRDAVVIDPCDAELVNALKDVLPGLLPAGWERDPVATSAIGVRRLGANELAEALSGLDRDPAWWGALYAAVYGVFGQDPDLSETLATLPVPLADGRTVRGARGSLLPVAELDASVSATLRPLGLRIVHPAALAGGSGPAALLERLGARPAYPRVLLDDVSVRGAITEPDDPAELAEAVLALVRAAEPGPHERFDLGDLLLPNDRGGDSKARELLLPGSPLAEVVDPEAFGFVDEGWVRRWGTETLRAVGVIDTFEIVRAENVLLDMNSLDDDLLDLDGIDEWVGVLRTAIDRSGHDMAPVALEVAAVRDLDLVTRWPRALEMLAGPGLRTAVSRPVRVLTDDGRPVELPSYASWWLSRHPVLDGRRPADLATGGGLLTGLYDPAPGDKDTEFDTEFLVRIGVRTTLSALLAGPGGPDELLDRLADANRPVGGSQLTALYVALSEAPPEHVAPPAELRAWQDGELVVADAADVVVIDAPDLLPLLDGRVYLAVPPDAAAALADLLDLDLVSEAITGAVTSEGEPRPVPDAVRELLPECPDTYFEHDELILDDTVEVAWRVVDGVPHASTFDGMARALAWVAGRWDRRHLVAALLAEPEQADELVAETYYE
ncbi:sacsin N-terminal ATP-binding-like domain-containing protein [Actinospica sp.]|uniref:sacsin N-terminal ATP-binding-like domain-containing protein n=1 Tax=Actinospica sp. TaxID=1872142 RepID=UPI002BBB85EA|nr:hypothetical protein [Actinospica sp.]HWG26294.1 hypothetical protein [Actinospica sp.]